MTHLTTTAPELAGHVDQLDTIDPAFWTQGYDLNPAAFDLMAVTTDGWVSCPTPNQGPHATATDGAAHGCAWHDFGARFSRNFEVSFVWSAVRPAEATPLIHVVPGTDRLGIGMWPGYDFTWGGAPQSVWLLGYIGANNTKFSVPAGRLLDAAELARWSDADRPAPPSPIRLRSTAHGNDDVVTVYVGGRLVEGIELVVPAELRRSSRHGFAIDNNQIDFFGGQGGAAYGGTDRIGGWPAARGPWSITKLRPGGVLADVTDRLGDTGPVVDQVTSVGAGIPTTGFHRVNELHFNTTTETLHRCTAAGVPGTWTP